jgi:hypothetical protein
LLGLQARERSDQVGLRPLFAGPHRTVSSYEKGTDTAGQLMHHGEPTLKSLSTLQRVIHLQMNKAAQLYLLMYQLVWEDKQHQKFWAQFGESLLYTLPSPPLGFCTSTAHLHHDTLAGTACR